MPKIKQPEQCGVSDENFDKDKICSKKYWNSSEGYEETSLTLW